MPLTHAVKRERPRLKVSGISKEAAAHVVSFITGAIVSGSVSVGSMSPFGASFAAAVPFGYLPSGVLGAAVSYLMTSPLSAFRYIAVIIAVAALRWILNEIKKISSSRFFAPAAAFFPVFVTGLALTASSRSEMGELYECLTEALLSAAGAYFMSRTAALMGSRRLLSGLRQEELACISMTGCILLLSLSPLTVGKASVGRVLAALSVMLFARYGMVKGGSVAGIATGISFALADTDMLFLSAGYSLAGLLGGLLAPMGKAAVVFSALLCDTMMAFSSPDRSMPLTILVETAAASAIFLLIPKEAGNFLSSIFTESPPDCSDAARRNVSARLSHCSKALGNVTGCVNAVSEKLARVSDSGMDSVFEAAADYTCKACGLRVYCWEKQRELTLDDMGRLGDTLRERGSVSEKDVEECFLKRCCKTRELAEGVNRAYKDYLSYEAAKRRVTQVRSVVAGQFAGLSDILMDISKEFESADDYDTEAAQRVTAAVSAIGLTAVECSCRRQKGRGMTVELELAISKKTAISKTQLAREVSKACGRYFDMPSLSFEGDRARAMMSELPLYSLEIGSSQHVCDDGELCGDCINYFNNGSGSTVALISDGMGTGGRAAVDSNMAVSLMSKLSRAGLSYDCSLTVVNSSLMIKSEEETLATLDLADFNLFTGRLRLMKAGACATFIRRGSRMLEKDMPSLPLGILNEVRFAKEEVSLSADDMVVMISDGALIGSPEWIEKLILSWRSSSPDELAAAIVEEARKRRAGSHDDDITAIAMRVTENV